MKSSRRTGILSEDEMFGSPSTALVLAPHTDDGEFGCGGTIARLVESGWRVVYAAYSSCDESLPGSMERGTLIKEASAATGRLGIVSDDVHIFDFPVRRFSDHRQDILQATIDLGRSVEPSVVFMPSLHDLHQDHQVVASEGCRAFKRLRLLSYELPWNNLSFSTQAFSALEERHVVKKISAIAAYESQADRSYVSPEYQRAHLITRGLQVNAPFAECFEVVRWIL